MLVVLLSQVLVRCIRGQLISWYCCNSLSNLLYACCHGALTQCCLKDRTVWKILASQRHMSAEILKASYRLAVLDVRTTQKQRLRHFLTGCLTLFLWSNCVKAKYLWFYYKGYQTCQMMYFLSVVIRAIKCYDVNSKGYQVIKWCT